MKKYLIIVEKSSLQKLIEDIYNKNKELLDYNADFISLNSPVSHISDRICKVDIKNKLWTKLELKRINVPNGYYIVNSNHSREKLIKIQSLIKNNNYDLIINACEIDLYGQLLYESVKERLSFIIPDKRMRICDLTEESILKSLQNFVDNDEYLNDVLNELKEFTY